jgi:hypothetical protein
MTFEGSTSFVVAEDVVHSTKTSTSLIGRYDAHRRTLQSESYKCRKLDIVGLDSLPHIQLYYCTGSCINKQCIRVKNIRIFVFLRRYEA